MSFETSSTGPETIDRVNGRGIDVGLGAVQGAVHEVRDALGGVGRAMPEVARASRSSVRDLFAMVESGSDERVSIGVSLTLGLAIGMLIGGAPRLLIALTLAPLAAMGLVLADRRAVVTKAT